MAKRRCISIDFYDSEEFCELTPQSKVLYTQLLLHSDDEGVVINPKATMRICKAKQRNLQELLEHRFLLFVDGVYLVRHWHIHNTIQPSRKIDSVYREQLSKVVLNESREYELKSNDLSTN